MALRRWSMTILPPAGRMLRGFAACGRLGCPASRWSPAELSQVCHKGPVSAGADTRAQAKVVVTLFDGTRHRSCRAGGGDADLPARPLRVPGLQSGGDVSGGDVVDVAGHAHLR